MNTGEKAPVEYRDDLEGVTARHLEGFFRGWPAPPSAETHLRILHRSDQVVLAWDVGADAVIGFINAVSDGILCAYVPLLEVRPEVQGRGIGSELVSRLLARLRGLYMIDLVCDADLMPFYERQGMQALTGMVIRNPGALLDGAPGDGTGGATAGD